MSDLEGFDLAAYKGTSHLLATRELVWYNDYVFKLLCRGLPKGNILEFGPGLGDFAGRFKRIGIDVDGVELEEQFHPVLKRACRRVFKRLSDTPGLYDAIVSVNVLEHIEDDRGTLKELHAKLRAGGVLTLYIPASQAIYGHMDALVAHFRRYDRADLVAKVEEAGFTVDEVFNVDSPGWFAMALYKVLRWGDGNFSPWSMKVYDKVVYPASRVLDPLVLWSFGRSVYLRARK